MEMTKVQFSIQEIETKNAKPKTFNLEGFLSSIDNDPSHCFLGIKANKRADFDRKHFTLKIGCIVTIENKSYSVESMLNTHEKICLVLKEIEARKPDILKLAAQQFISAIN